LLTSGGINVSKPSPDVVPVMLTWGLAKAKEYYLQASKIMPSSSVAISGRCWIYIAEENRSKAERHIKNFLKLNRNENLNYLLASLYESEGNVELANYYYELASETRKCGYDFHAIQNYRKIRDILI
jgi:hypothetical protein